MNANKTNTIIKRRTFVAIFALAALALLPATIFARGGEEHVTGTVAAITETEVSVKTTEGNVVVVGFNEKTTFTQDKKRIQKSDIKVGNRIVIHGVEVDGKLAAHTVEIEAASTTKP